MQKAANSSTPPSKRPCRRRNRIKNARRRSKDRQQPACKKRQIRLRHRRDDHAGGETRLKMHAGEAKNGSGQRAKGGKFVHATVKTIAPAEKQNEKCTPARRGTAVASVQKAANSPPADSKRSCRRRNKIKNARWRSKERQQPACKRQQIRPRHRRNDSAGGETRLKMHAGEAKNGSSQRVKSSKFVHATVKTIAPAEKRD